jgi:putative transposase
MSKGSSDTFVLELPLVISPQEEKEINIRFEASRHLYNACLGECLRCIALIRQSKTWSQARALTKTSENIKERRELYSKSQKEYQFSEYAMHFFAATIRKGCWIENHVDSSLAQKIATKAFLSAKEYLVGKKGRPRFRSRDRFRSVEGKSNVSGIRWKNGSVIWGIRGGKTLKMDALFDLKDVHGVQAHGLNSRTKYVRLVRKDVRGEKRYYVQLVQEGRSLLKMKNSIGKEVIGLDIGPSTIATVAGSSATLGLFCDGLEVNQEKIAQLQKKMDRSRRQTNQGNFNEDDTVKKGSKKWVRSKSYLKMRSEVAEFQRKLSETRKCMHGNLANAIISKGIFIRTEKLSYKKLQKDFGRSVGFRAPGMFISLLRRKAESAGGFVEEFSTYRTKLSQTCHCGKQTKKKLSERWHHCSCGIYAQRDLYSAHLARFVEGNHLDTSQASKAWPAAEPLLEHAVSRLNQLANGKARLSSFGLDQRKSRSHVKGGSLSIEAVDVVGANREPQRACQFASRTPCL